MLFQCSFHFFLHVLDFLRNDIRLLNLLFLASLSLNFSTRCSHMLSKFIDKSAQKASIFSSKANYARSLLNLYRICLCLTTMKILNFILPPKAILYSLFYFLFFYLLCGENFLEVSCNINAYARN